MAIKKTAKKTSKKTAAGTAGKSPRKSSAKKTAAKKTAVKKTAVKKSAKKTGKQSAGKAAGKTLKKAGKKTAKKTVKKGVRKTAKKAAKKTVRKTVKKTAAKKIVKKISRKSARKPSRAGAPSALEAERREVRARRSLAEEAFEEIARRFGAESAANGQTAVEASKFELEPRGARHEPDLSDTFFRRELDDSYDETKIVLLVRDPEWVFVYWDVAEEARRRFDVPRGAPRRMVVRWYDVTDLERFTGDNAHLVMDVDVNDQTSSWYQKMPEPNRSWCADLGVFADDGSFQTICRSNVVQTPRTAMAPAEAEELWMLVEPRERRRFAMRLPRGVTVSSFIDLLRARGLLLAPGQETFAGLPGLEDAVGKPVDLAEPFELERILSSLLFVEGGALRRVDVEEAEKGRADVSSFRASESFGGASEGLASKNGEDE